MPKYQEKREVDARQLLDTIDSIINVASWSLGIDLSTDVTAAMSTVNAIRADGGFNLTTAEGIVKVGFNDWVVQRLGGEFIKYGPVEFAQHYEAVET